MLDKDKWNRRDFIRYFGTGILALQVIPALGQEGSLDSAADSLVIKSGESAFAPLPGHFHFIKIPMEYLERPPSKGIRLKTTWAYLHRHRV